MKFKLPGKLTKGIPAFKLPGVRIARTLLGKEPFLGVDIGTTSIKAVEISPSAKGNGLELSNYSVLETFEYLERSNQALQASNLALLEKETAFYLKVLLNRSGFRTKTAIASIPAFSAFTTLVDVPKMSDSEIEKMMQLQAKQYIPMSIDQVTVDYVKVGEYVDEQGATKARVLLISIVNEHLVRYKNIFKSAGLHLQSVEIEGMSLARAITTKKEQPVLIVDIGSRSTGLVVAEKGNYLFGTQTDFAGSSITQTLSNALNISVRRAEDLKKLRGLNVTGGEKELSTLMEPILDVIINEAQRTKKNFEETYKGTISEVMLTGGGANLAGIEQYFKSQIDISISKANPFEVVNISYPQIIQPITKEIGPLLGVAIGLGTKGFN
jgi:type IV pilus assembly protein PilM